MPSLIRTLRTGPELVPSWELRTEPTLDQLELDFRKGAKARGSLQQSNKIKLDQTPKNDQWSSEQYFRYFVRPETKPK